MRIGWPGAQWSKWLRGFNSHQLLLTLRTLFSERNISPRKIVEIRLNKELNLLDGDYILDLYFNR